MAINIKIGDQATQEDDSVKIKIKDPTLKERYNFKLELRRALNGDLLIFDHADIDIVVLKEKKKIVAFAKDIMSEIVYGAENRLFEYLRKKGIIAYDSIQGGNVYGSLEGALLESKEVDSVKAALYQISEWITTERPYFESAQAHDDMMDDALLDPDADNSTELGEVPQEEEKGSILQHNLFAPYLYGRYTY
tara:strand:- start:700 stop:1275 length:576 start_codon:yes stop_codon:yes gene_type:complete